MMTSPTSEGSPGGPVPAPTRRPRRGFVGGLVLIAVGAILLADNLFPGFNAWEYWPLILVVIGVAILWNSRSSS